MVSSSSAHWFAPFVLVLFVFVGFNIQVDATAVGGQGEVAIQDVMESQALLSELMSALGGGHQIMANRLSGIETALSPMFAALPKNEHGHLDRPAVRYVLHRLFVQRHGMFLKGLEPVGQKSNSPSISGILDREVPYHVMGLLEDRVGGRGLGIHEIAVLAATLEHVVHDEAIDRLKFAYASLGLSVDQHATEEQVLEAIEVYMVLFVRGINRSAMTFEEVRELAEIQRIYATWPVTQEFARGVRRDVIKTASMADTLTFDTTARVVEEIGERYGRFQDRECRDLKGALLEQGDQGVGRVLLKDFYEGDVNGSFSFGESADYLRELGALDESDPARVSVIVPNYINSPTNCLNTASIYKVCCIDECEEVLGHLEREVSAPDAGPERIIEIVSHLASASVEVPRILPSSLVSRLHDVARHHSGRVPLHGRLFSQWLHHAYPRECPYPHVAGTIRPQTVAEWMQAGNSVDASPSEIEKLYEVKSRSSAKPKRTAEESLQWEQTEELFVERWSPSRRAAPARSSLAESCRGLLFLAALVAMGLWFKDTHSGAKMS